MMIEEKERHMGSESGLKENFMIQITNPMLYDRLHTLSVEYSLSDEALVSIAIKRLLDDVGFVRSLRTGGIKLES